MPADRLSGSLLAPPSHHLRPLPAPFGLGRGVFMRHNSDSESRAGSADQSNVPLGAPGVSGLERHRRRLRNGFIDPPNAPRSQVDTARSHERKRIRTP
ncbi:hypothetical protein SKAU_G00073180 [Synaphobranchus kaupii]|uniref:Uncharacterized protein n=1 Tax=Synaphobranchus kaupii TaxID=118154 RepID=A0A9Q1G815_SYNKA|nr:hypothetical protein SKAU_G00073180 [Synaphobranchus kaupii]